MTVTLSEVIASYRRQKRQVHNASPWTQEDLAVAIGTDKAHINRIERGRQVPARDTVIRICHALDVPWDLEQELLVGLRYAPDLRLATLAELNAIVAEAARLVDDLEYPAFLGDIIGRIWYANPVARAFLGIAAGPVLEHYPGCASLVEALADEHLSGSVRRLVPEDVIVRRLAQARLMAGLWRQTTEWRDMIARLLRDPHFAYIWHQSYALEDMVDYVDRVAETLEHPLLGTVQILYWTTRLRKDRRFVVVHHLPADGRARAAFHMLARKAADRRST